MLVWLAASSLLVQSQSIKISINIPLVQERFIIWFVNILETDGPSAASRHLAVIFNWTMSFPDWFKLGWIVSTGQVEAEWWRLMEPIIWRLFETPIWLWRYELGRQISNCLSFFFFFFFFICQLKERQEKWGEKEKEQTVCSKWVAVFTWTGLYSD